MPPETSELKIDFIGIGVPKAATTWLTSVLTDHPDLFLPEVKETHFFAYPYDDTPFSTYEEFFQSAAPGQKLGEFSVDYFAYPATAKRLVDCFPEIKIILSLRNPISQIYSNYWHSLRQGFNCRDDSQPGFETALERHADILLEPAKYGQHLQRWQSLIAPEKMLILFHEDIVKSPEIVTQKLWEFLEVTPPAPIESNLPAQDTNSRKGVSLRSGRSAAVYNRLYFAANRFLLRPIARFFGYQSSFKIIQKLRLRQISEAIFFRSGYPPMSEEQKSHVRQLLQADLDHLESLTGRDLSHWT